MEQRVDRVEAAIADFRAHTDTQFAAVRREMTTEFAAVRGEIATESAKLRSEMTEGFDAIHQVLIRMQTQIDTIQVQHRKDFESLNTRVSVLHEDIIARIATLGELWTPRPPRRRKKG